MVTRCLSLGKLQMETSEQSPMQIKWCSWRYLVKHKHHEPCGLPTDAARVQHCTTHVPFRDWCQFCVASRGQSSSHRRVVVNKTADTLPRFQADYIFIRTVAESKTQPCMSFVETRSGSVISFTCAKKERDEDLTTEKNRYFVSSYCFLNSVIVHCDKELSIIDVCRKVAVTIRAKNESSGQCFCWSSALTHTRTRTMLSDTNRNEHGHTAFSNISCTCSSLR